MGSFGALFTQGKKQTNVYTLHYATSGNETFKGTPQDISFNGSRSNSISLYLISFD